MTDLFSMLAEDAGPTARASDPATSHAAAAEATGAQVGGQRLAVLWALDAIDRSEGRGATARDIGMRLAYQDCPHYRGVAPQQNVIARRLSDLGVKGLAVATEDVRDRCQVWRITADGRRAAIEAAAS